MATLDLRGATSSVDLRDLDLVEFGSLLGTPTPTTWSYLTPAGNRVVVSGAGLRFDASGNPVAGSVNAMSIDVGNNGGADLVLTGINVAASPLGAVLRSSPAGLWNLVLGGDDVILGPENVLTPFTSVYLVGDGLTTRAGESSGGRDVLHLGNESSNVEGDVQYVGSPVVGAAVSTFHGGDDQILGLVTDKGQSATGDAGAVRRGNALYGGDDVILIQSKHFRASATGDAGDASGRVVGGDDTITGGKDFGGHLYGDVREAHPTGVVTGGDDLLNGGDLNELLVGDVGKLRGGRLAGGDDRINGGGGNDRIAGDAWEVRSDSTGRGGNDVIFGGGSNDEIFGDFTQGGSGVAGGADRLYGEGGQDVVHGEGGADTVDGGAGFDILHGGDGDDWVSGGADGDRLYGGAGADMLDGGAGGDAQFGSVGNDVYFVNHAGDTVTEEASQGADTVWSFLNDATLAANVENLRFNGVGDFRGAGNGLANLIAGSAGADRLDGGAGDDLLIGGLGGDALIGGLGSDTASYAAATAGVEAILLAPGANAGEADGDSYGGVENLTGSDFGDVLGGDAAGNALAGRGGGDVLSGHLGDDTLRGGGGADILIGDAGGDRFDFDAASDSAAGARDVIRAGLVPAFEGAGVAGGDRIDLAGIDANNGVAGDQAFVFGGVGAGRVSVVASGGDTLVRANTDTDTAFEFELLIADGAVQPSAYQAADFVL